MDSFSGFPFATPIADAIKEAGYTTPTPIQAQAIPEIVKGRDVIGIAQTGTGKTAAYVLPILQHLINHPKVPVRGSPRVLILVPTRELAQQVTESFHTYGKHLHFTYLALFGGVPQGPQTHALSKAVEVIVATPGRLMDLMRQRFVQVQSVELLVLDEADRMLDMGFADDIRLLASDLPDKRQTLLFSATMSTRIAALAHNFLTSPVKVTVSAENSTIGKIAQSVMFVDKEDKALLLKRVLDTDNVKRAIVFVPMKHVADRLVMKLAAEKVPAEALHSDKTQAMRTQIMNDFRAGKTRVLIATDIAARGIDVDDITHVINYDLPKDPETYVHRIGRTARAGAAGTAISFCSGEERSLLLAIEKLITKKLTVREHKYHSTFAQNGGVMSHAKPLNAAGQKATGRGGGKTNSNHLARKNKNWKQK